MIIRKYKTEPEKENPHGFDLRKLYDKPSAQIMHMTFKPGESIPQVKDTLIESQGTA